MNSMKVRLSLMDGACKSFAREVKGEYSAQAKEQLTRDHEVRTVCWRAKGLDNIVQVYPSFTSGPENRVIGWNFWVCSSLDEDGKRYWKRKLIVETGKMEDIVYRIDDLLATAREFFKTTSRKDLEFATELER